MKTIRVFGPIIFSILDWPMKFKVDAEKFLLLITRLLNMLIQMLLLCLQILHQEIAVVTPFACVLVARYNNCFLLLPNFLLHNYFDLLHLSRGSIENNFSTSVR